MAIKNNNYIDLIKKYSHHLLIIVVLAILSILAYYDQNKEISNTYMIWDIIYISFLVMAIFKNRNKK